MHVPFMQVPCQNPIVEVKLPVLQKSGVGGGQSDRVHFVGAGKLSCIP